MDLNVLSLPWFQILHISCQYLGDLLYSCDKQIRAHVFTLNFNISFYVDVKFNCF